MDEISYEDFLKLVGGTPLVVGIIEAPRYPVGEEGVDVAVEIEVLQLDRPGPVRVGRSEEHTSELQSLVNLVCRLLLEQKKK